MKLAQFVGGAVFVGLFVLGMVIRALPYIAAGMLIVYLWNQ